MKKLIILTTLVLILSGCDLASEQSILEKSENDGYQTYREILCIGEKLAQIPPNRKVLYEDYDIGYQLYIPYNKDWAVDGYSLEPYEKIDDKLIFGPYYPVYGSAECNYYWSDLKINTYDSYIFKIGHPVDLDYEDISSESITDINGWPVASYITKESKELFTHVKAGELMFTFHRLEADNVEIDYFYEMIEDMMIYWSGEDPVSDWYIKSYSDDGFFVRYPKQSQWWHENTLKILGLEHTGKTEANNTLVMKFETGQYPNEYSFRSFVDKQYEKVKEPNEKFPKVVGEMDKMQVQNKEGSHFSFISDMVEINYLYLPLLDNKYLKIIYDLGVGGHDKYYDLAQQIFNNIIFEGPFELDNNKYIDKEFGFEFELPEDGLIPYLKGPDFYQIDTANQLMISGTRPPRFKSVSFQDPESNYKYGFILYDFPAGNASKMIEDIYVCGTQFLDSVVARSVYKINNKDVGLVIGKPMGDDELINYHCIANNPDYSLVFTIRSSEDEQEIEKNNQIIKDIIKTLKFN